MFVSEGLTPTVSFLERLCDSFFSITFSKSKELFPVNDKNFIPFLRNFILQWTVPLSPSLPPWFLPRAPEKGRVVGRVIFCRIK